VVLLVRVLVVLAVVGSVGSVAATDATVETPEPRHAERVLIVSYPRLTWDVVNEQRPRELLALTRRGAAASTTVRTVGERTTLAEGYTAIGAGARFDAEPGLLGETLAANGRRVAVIGNADRGRGGDISLVHREASLAVMDRAGRVGGGDTGQSLLRDDPSAPFGVRAAPKRVLDAFRSAWHRADVVLVEMSDLERADAYESSATATGGRDATRRSLADADRLLGRLLARVDLDRDLVLLVAPAAPRTGEELTVAVMAGAGVEPGRAGSATTRRTGLVTLTDVAPTVLNALGLERPAAMVGSPFVSTGKDPVVAEDAGWLATFNRRAVFRDGAVTPIAGAFVAFQLLTYALAALAIARRRARLREIAGFLALVTLAYPPFVFLSALVPYERLSVAGYMAALFACSAGLAWLARAAARRAPLWLPLVLIGFTVSVLLLDVMTGGHLQLNTVFGYSPIVAGRFTGFGNQAFALLSMGGIVLATGVWGRLAGRGLGRTGLAIATGVLLVAIVADGHPALGADVGGVLALVPAAAVVVLLLSGARLRLRRWLLVGALTLVVLSVFALVDAARPAESQTHSGRLIERVHDGGGGELLTVVQRKAGANLHMVLSSAWSLIIPLAMACLTLLTWRQPPLLRALQQQAPGFRACAVGGIFAGALGFAANDSGVAVLAMMLGVALPYVTYLAMALSGREPDRLAVNSS
jgi:hypothetical protein